MRVSTKLMAMTLGTVAVVSLVGITCYCSVLKLIETNRWVIHTEKVLEELRALLGDLTAVTADQRGYILTTDQECYTSYRTNSEQVRSRLLKLRSMVQDNPTQLSRLDALEPLIKERLEAYDDAIDTFKSEGQDAAAKKIQADKVLKFIHQVRTLIDAVRQEELTLLEARNQDMDRSASLAQLIIICGNLTILAFVCIFNYLFTTDVLWCVKALLKASENAEQGRFDPVNTKREGDEFSELATAFNQLGFALEEANRRIDEESRLKEAALASQKALQERAQVLKSHLDALRHAMKGRMAEQEEQPAWAGTWLQLVNELAHWAGQIEDLSGEALKSCEQATVMASNSTRAYSDLLLAVNTLLEHLRQSRSCAESVLNEAHSVFAAKDLVDQLAMEISLEAARFKAEEPGGATASAILQQLSDLSARMRSERLSISSLILKFQTATCKQEIISCETLSCGAQLEQLLEPLSLNLARLCDHLSGMERSMTKLCQLSSERTLGITEGRQRLQEMLINLEQQNRFVRELELKAASVEA